MKAFEKIIGYKTEKKELMRIADVLKNTEYYKKLGASTPSGLLINGRPGLGKTLMANALIEASGRPAFLCRKDRPDGDFVNYIKETFDKAVENAPSIVFLDDMDKFANEGESKPNAEEYVTVQSCIDSVKGKEVFVLATANKKRNLPDSLIRAGRFDRIIDVFSPQYEEAVEIIKHYLKNKDIMSDVNPEYIARLMHRSSCATIEALINEAAVLAGYEKCGKIKLEHFIEASMKAVFRNYGFEVFTEKINLDDSKNKQAEIVYHEAGHAVVSELLSPESVTLVAISEHTGQTACFDKYSEENKFYSHLDTVIAFAGLAAVDQRYGQRGFGGVSDLSDVRSNLHRALDLDAGFGFGFIDQASNDSQARQTKIETAVDLLCERYFYKAKEILAQNREFLDKVATELAEKKVLTTYDIQRIKSTCNIKEVKLEW